MCLLSNYVITMISLVELNDDYNNLAGSSNPIGANILNWTGLSKLSCLDP